MHVDALNIRHHGVTGEQRRCSLLANTEKKHAGNIYTAVIKAVKPPRSVAHWDWTTQAVWLRCALLLR